MSTARPSNWQASPAVLAAIRRGEGRLAALRREMSFREDYPDEKERRECIELAHSRLGYIRIALFHAKQAWVCGEDQEADRRFAWHMRRLQAGCYPVFITPQPSPEPIRPHDPATHPHAVYQFNWDTGRIEPDQAERSEA